MRKIISKIADSYGLYSLHKEYSRNDHFYYDEDEVLALNSDYLKFYTNPFLPQIYFEDDKIKNGYLNRKLKFLSQVENGNSNTHAIFHSRICEAVDKNINVVLVHGWRANDLNRLESVFLNSFVEKKYNVYSYVLPFHMERCPNTSIYSGEYFLTGNVSRTLKSVQQSVSDIRALISYIKTKGNGKIILIGLSLGAVITNLLCEVEKNIDILISLFYANDLSFTVFETEAGKFIKKDFVKNNFDRNLLNKSWSIINPNFKKPVIGLDKILLISGAYDKYVLNEDTDQLWENWGRPERKKYSCGHSGIVLCKNKIKNDTLKFISKRV